MLFPQEFTNECDVDGRLGSGQNLGDDRALGFGVVVDGLPLLQREVALQVRVGLAIAAVVSQPVAKRDNLG